MRYEVLSEPSNLRVQHDCQSTTLRSDLMHPCLQHQNHAIQNQLQSNRLFHSFQCLTSEFSELLWKMHLRRGHLQNLSNQSRNVYGCSLSNCIHSHIGLLASLRHQRSSFSHEPKHRQGYRVRHCSQAIEPHPCQMQQNVFHRLPPIVSHIRRHRKVENRSDLNSTFYAVAKVRQ